MITVQKGLFKGEGKLTQSFGVNAAAYEKFGLKGHNGVDYGILTGTELYSCINGTITELGKDTYGYGIYVKIENEECGVLYAHLKEWKVGLNTKVKAGQLIGLSNNTGNSTGPHLHFALFPKPRNRNNGYAGYIDPLDKKLVNWVDKISTTEPTTTEILPNKELPEGFYKINEFTRGMELYDLKKGDAFDTILDKANNKVAELQVEVAEKEKKIINLNADHKIYTESIKEANRKAVEDLILENGKLLKEQKAEHKIEIKKLGDKITVLEEKAKEKENFIDPSKCDCTNTPVVDKPEIVIIPKLTSYTFYELILAIYNKIKNVK